MSGYHRELKLETAINPGKVKEKTIKMPGDLAERLGPRTGEEGKVHAH